MADPHHANPTEARPGLFDLQGQAGAVGPAAHVVGALGAQQQRGPSGLVAGDQRIRCWFVVAGGRLGERGRQAGELRRFVGPKRILPFDGAWAVAIEHPHDPLTAVVGMAGEQSGWCR